MSWETRRVQGERQKMLGRSRLLRSLRPREVVRRYHQKSASWRCDCITVQIEGRSMDRHFRWWEKKPENLLYGCKKSGRGFTGYQRCDWSDTLLLKDNRDEHYTAQESTDWHKTDVPNIIFSSLRLCRTCMSPDVNCMAKMICEPQPSSFTYHNWPPPIVKVVRLERFISVNWD